MCRTFTALLLLAYLAGLACMNVVANPLAIDPPNLAVNPFAPCRPYEHGWPMVYLRRHRTYLAMSQFSPDPYDREASMLPVDGAIAEFSAPRLAVNIAIVIAGGVLIVLIGGGSRVPTAGCFHRISCVFDRKDV